MEYDLHSYVKVLVALDYQVINTDTVTDGNQIDTLGFESLEYAILTATITAAGVVAVILEESDTGAWAGEESVVPADETLGGTIVFADGDDDAIFRCGSIGKKRYQRITLDSDATTNGAFAAIAILSNPKTIPVAEQVT
jgi:hypothetical protein